MNLSQSISEMKMLVQQAEVEVNLLQSGRNASSARARKSLQQIKTQAHSLRKAITEHSKALPTKPRAKKVVIVVEEPAVPVEVAPVEEPVKEKKRVKKTKTAVV